MSDTVKLIIEISKENLKRISDGEWIGTHAYDNMILNGTPLDTVKTEIEELETYDGIYIDRDYVLEILDRIGKESEE